MTKNSDTITRKRWDISITENYVAIQPEDRLLYDKAWDLFCELLFELANDNSEKGESCLS